MLGPPLAADKPAFLRSTDQYPPCRQSSVREVCLPLRSRYFLHYKRACDRLGLSNSHHQRHHRLHGRAVSEIVLSTHQLA